jgi:hypothetical protein
MKYFSHHLALASPGVPARLMTAVYPFQLLTQVMSKVSLSRHKLEWIIVIRQGYGGSITDPRISIPNSSDNISEAGQKIKPDEIERGFWR